MCSGELHRSLVALDIDGTCAGAGGPVTSEMIKTLDSKRVFWGILSSRAPERSKEVTDAMEINPQFFRTCRVYQRAEELNALRDEFPGHDQYIYVADAPQDEEETLRAGWRFYHASRFEELLDALRPG